MKHNNYDTVLRIRRNVKKKHFVIVKTMASPKI